MSANSTGIGILQVVTRNITPLIGILFFHWSSNNVLFLYLLDTILSMGVIFAGLAKFFSDKANDPTALQPSGARNLVVALLLCAVFFIPLGMPAIIVLARADFSFATALADKSLLIGIVIQCLMVAGSYYELYRALATHSPSELRLKQRFGLILMRWVAVLGVCYVGIEMLPGSILVFLLVATYVGASIFAEIFPDRFLRGTPAEDVDEVRTEPSHATGIGTAGIHRGSKRKS